MSSDLFLFALSPLDGRYQNQCQALFPLASEYGLIYYRLLVEVRWFQTLASTQLIAEIPPLSPSAKDCLDALINQYNVQWAARIKEIESKTNHDVKAIEYFIKEYMATHPELKPLIEFVHFGCTSEDINNLAYALMVKDLREKILLPQLNKIDRTLKTFAKRYANVPMLSRTHGQPASPTTLGKEIANTDYRLHRLIKQLSEVEILGKINGAVGNFNAHHVAYPEVDWIALSQSFVEALGLKWNPMTTQIEPHDYLANYFDTLARINTVLIDFCRDVWGYIGLGYFIQVPAKNEVGSSTMPHKVNPIDFENAEGNLGLANALFRYFSEKLPISRWQRDLSDSTVLRNIGVGCGYMFIALKSILRGLNKLAINPSQLEKDLNNNWEVLGEALQTVMRRYNIPEPYEQIKSLTRGKKITPQALYEFIDTLALPYEVKISLKNLTPAQYTGLAQVLVDKLI